MPLTFRSHSINTYCLGKVWFNLSVPPSTSGFVTMTRSLSPSKAGCSKTNLLNLKILSFTGQDSLEAWVQSMLKPNHLLSNFAHFQKQLQSLNSGERSSIKHSINGVMRITGQSPTQAYPHTTQTVSLPGSDNLRRRVCSTSAPRTLLSGTEQSWRSM